MSKIFFHEADKTLSLRNRKGLKLFIEALFKSESKDIERIDYIFCSDEYLLKINRDFLNHDFFTDIITFDLSEQNDIKGEIYISLDRVIDNSNILQTDQKEELLRVIFHGALHLCGYKDKTQSQKKIMRAKEDYYILLYRFT